MKYYKKDIIRCLVKKNKIFNNLDNTNIKFEYKYNWDLYIKYIDKQQIDLTSILEIEQNDKIKYKKQYDIEENEKYNNNLLLLEKFIEELIKFEEENTELIKHFKSTFRVCRKITKSSSSKTKTQ